MTYKPRNKNPRTPDEPVSTSKAFDRLVERRRGHQHPCGFRVEDKA